ncbi:MAG: caspase family protein [Gammaproteobacteria bacterium]|nr:caspase family protein [Gammaproteobacteria bacterium]
MIFTTNNFMAYISSRERSFYANLIVFWIGIALMLSGSIAYATYPPTFSDCTYGGGEEYDQVDACKQLLRSNSKRRKLHVALGKTLDKRNKFSQAVEAYQNALQIFPEDDYFTNKLAIAKSNLDEKKWLNNKNKVAQSPSLKPASDKTAKLPFPAKKITARKSTLPVDKSQTISRKNITQSKTVQKNVAAITEKNTRTQLRPEQQKFMDKLTLLKSLRSQGIISESDYQQRKKAIIDANFRVISSTQIASSENNARETVSQKSRDMLKGLKFGNYHALIIGNNKYKHLPVLETAVNDAQSLAKLLKTEYGFKVKLLLNASRYDTLKAMGEFRRTLTKNDNLLIYYAGHGILDRASERGYWLPVNAEQDFNANWISTSEITDTLKALQAWHVLVVADSCYSGTLVRSASVKLTTPEEQVSLFKRLLKKKSRTVITSGGLEPVTDSGGDNHSVFSQSLLDVLKNNTQAIETEQVFSQIRDKVILNADQTPEYSDVRKVGHNGGDFIFVRR